MTWANSFKGFNTMLIYQHEQSTWQAAAVGYLLKNANPGSSFEDTAATACQLADALILEMRNRKWN